MFVKMFTNKEVIDIAGISTLQASVEAHGPISEINR